MPIKISTIKRERGHSTLLDYTIRKVYKWSDFHSNFTLFALYDGDNGLTIWWMMVCFWLAYLKSVP